MYTTLEETEFANADNYLDRANTFQPSSLDPYLLDDYKDYFYLPLLLTRDSEPLEQSNYECAKEVVWEASNMGETTELTFSHWACGWLKLIVIHQDDKPGIIAAINLVKALEDYPVLNEERFAELELEEAQFIWDNNSLDDRINICREAGISIFAARRDDVPIDYYSRNSFRVIDYDHHNSTH